MVRNIKNITKKMIVSSAYREAKKSANSTCAFLHGQPRLPECVKKLNKSNE